MLRTKYRMTSDDYDMMYALQEGRCAICDTWKVSPGLGIKIQDTLYVDHCHAGGHVRGLLCYPCNTMLGHIENFGIDIANIALYLEGRQQ